MFGNLISRRKKPKEICLNSPKHKSNLKTKFVDNWTEREVALWLEEIGLGEYANAFVQNKITGEELMELTEKDLDEIGILPLGHRKKFHAHLMLIMKNTSVFSLSSAPNAKKIHVEIVQKSASDNNNNINNNARNNSSSHQLIDRMDIESNLDHIDSFNELYEEITAKVRNFQLMESQKMQIEYIDPDGDVIKIKKANHLRAALVTAPSPVVLRCFV